MSFAIALSDEQWDLVADLFDPPGRRGAPAQIPRRQMVEAMLFLARTGCQWRYLPERYGSWTAVWAQWRRWRANGVSASFWNGLEARYREALANDRARRELAAYAEWSKAFPVSEMVRRRILPERPSVTDSVADLLSFFRVSNPAGWEQQWRRLAASYRRSNAYKPSEPALKSRAWMG
jgi:transposase